jgi:hypothetical protein
MYYYLVLLLLFPEDMHWSKEACTQKNLAIRTCCCRRSRHEGSDLLRSWRLHPTSYERIVSLQPGAILHEDVLHRYFARQ